MNYFVSQNGQQLGPFTEPVLKAKLASGEISPQDLVWWDGQADWKPIAQTALAAGGASLPPPAPPRPPAPAAGAVYSGEQKTSGLAIASLTCGILGIFFTFLTGIPAIIMGHISLSRIKSDPTLRGHGIAMTGTVMGYVTSFLLPIISIVAISVLIALGQQVKDAAANQSSTNDTTVQAPSTTNSDTTPSQPDTNSATTNAPATNAPASNQ